MIKVDKKNKWAVDLAIHIPMPSFEIKITNTDKEEIENVELTYTRSDVTETPAPEDDGQ